MYHVSISEAEIFYGEPRRRLLVKLDDNLRNLTKKYAERMHELFSSGITPQPIYKKHCHSCSLYNICKPRQISRITSVTDYLKKSLSFDS
jgi:CRISPR-associated exonuclease Cas4